MIVVIWRCGYSDGANWEVWLNIIQLVQSVTWHAAQKPQVEGTKVIELDSEDEKAPPPQPVEQNPAEREDKAADYRWTTSTQR